MGSPEELAVDDSETETPANPAPPELDYSTFSARQKNTIIGLAAFAGWFSSISSFIYFPAIPFLAVDLHVDIQQVNLTVTSYLIMSGVFPSIMGDAADRFGRRPVFLVALAVYFFANVGLALQSQFALLFVFRMFQSAGISGTFSIAYGVLSDLFTPAERGWYSGVLAFLCIFPVSPLARVNSVSLLTVSVASTPHPASDQPSAACCSSVGRGAPFSGSSPHLQQSAFCPWSCSSPKLPAA